jgi:hypothetical protein
VDGLHVEIELCSGVWKYKIYRYRFLHVTFVSVTKGGFNPLLVDSDIDVKSAS